MKKIFLAVTLFTFLLGAALPALAVSPFTPGQSKQVKHQKGDKKCGLESIIKESLERNNKDLAKVKQDLDKQFAGQKEKREAKLKEIAEKKNVTVEELKKQFQQKQQDRLAKKAAEKGVSVDQLKQEMTKKHAARMEEMAKNLNITPDQLKQLLPEHPAK